MKKLDIFVSSTCYDLSQIRKDIHDYIESCGHIAMLSEFKIFPVSANNNIKGFETVSRCSD